MSAKKWDYLSLKNVRKIITNLSNQKSWRLHGLVSRKVSTPHRPKSINLADQTGVSPNKRFYFANNAIKSPKNKQLRGCYGDSKNWFFTPVHLNTHHVPIQQTQNIQLIWTADSPGRWWVGEFAGWACCIYIFGFTLALQAWKVFAQQKICEIQMFSFFLSQRVLE